MEEEQKNTESNESSETLETLEDKDTAVTATPKDGKKESVKDKLPKKGKPLGDRLKALVSRLNVYLLVFILLAVVSLIVLFVVINSSNREAAKDEAIETQELTQEAIESLSGNEVTVGDPKQLLSVESNAVFAGKVLIRDGLDVAGPIKVGGALNLPGITVSGTSEFDEVILNQLTISGDTNVLGSLNVQNGFSASGTISFNGPVSATSLTVDEISLSGDLKFSRHIDAGGGTPSVSGSNVGSGGTVTMSGTDTSGTVSINVGSGASSGVLATVTFVSAYNNTPHVVMTPVTNNGSLAAINYYVTNRTTTGFSIAATNAPSAGSISFDYIVID